MQTDFCWDYFYASKGDIITEELYGSYNDKKLKEKQLYTELFSLQNRKQYINTLPSATALIFLSTRFIVLFSGYQLTFSKQLLQFDFGCCA